MDKEWRDMKREYTDLVSSQAMTLLVGSIKGDVSSRVTKAIAHRRKGKTKEELLRIQLAEDVCPEVRRLVESMRTRDRVGECDDSGFEEIIMPRPPYLEVFRVEKMITMQYKVICADILSQTSRNIIPVKKYSFMCGSVPYGIGAWDEGESVDDHAWGKEQFTPLLQSLSTLTTAQNYSVLTMVASQKHWELQTAYQDFFNAGTNRPYNAVYFDKQGKPPLNNLCLADTTEVGAVGYYSAAGKRQPIHLPGKAYTTSLSIMLRFPHMRSKFKVPGESEVANKTQHDAAPWYWFFKTHTQPGDWVTARH